MASKMTSKQAFKAMFCFLEDYYNKTLSDDLGSLLGDMQLFEDGITWDNAAWSDWMIALGNNDTVSLLDAFKGMFNFLNAYYERTSFASSDIKSLLDVIALDEYVKPLNSAAWNIWINCVEKNE